MKHLLINVFSNGFCRLGRFLRGNFSKKFGVGGVTKFPWKISSGAQSEDLGPSLIFDSGVDDTAVDINDSSVAMATTEGCCTNLLPAARAAVYLYLYRPRTLDKQPRAFDRAIL